MYEVQGTISNYTAVIAALVGSAATVYLIIGVWMWMTATDSPQQAQAGIRQMFRAVVGIAIVGLTWAIVQMFADRVIGSPVDFIIPTPMPPTPTPGGG